MYRLPRKLSIYTYVYLYSTLTTTKIVHMFLRNCVSDRYADPENPVIARLFKCPAWFGHGQAGQHKELHLFYLTNEP